MKSWISKILSHPKLVPCIVAIAVAVAMILVNSYENSAFATGGGGFIREGHH